MSGWLRRIGVRRVGLLVLLAGLAGAGTVAGRHLWAWHHFRAAVRALEQGAVPRARRHLGRCLKVWPNGVETRLLAARAARLAGAYDEAERHLQVCEQAGGDTPALRLELQLLQAQQGDLSPPLESLLWGRIAEDHPQTTLIFEALALGYLYVYRLGEAYDCLTQWLAREPNQPQALYLRGLVREGLQQLSQAGADYRRAVELAPEHYFARKRLAEYQLFSHQANEAAEHFERLLQEEPDSPELRFGLARCRREQGDHEAAREILDRLLDEQKPRFAWLMERARLAQAETDHAAAEKWFRRAHEHDPHDPDVCYALAACLSRRGQKEEARRLRQRGKEIERDLEQLRHLHEQIGKRPGDAELRYQAGLICLRNGQKEEGRRWLLSAVRLAPGHEGARRALLGGNP